MFSPLKHSSAQPALLLLAALLLLQPLFAAQPPTPQPIPPVPPSPIDQFRGWLKLEAPEREKALAEWPEAKRTVILQKLKAYETLPAQERDRRLKMLELRWYMRPLMSLPPAERSSRLSLIPARLREIISQRLAQWDALDPEIRKQVIQNEDARELVTSYFSQLKSGRSESAVLYSLDENRQRELRKALETWRNTSYEDQQRMADQLAGFFDLPKEAQTWTLGELSDAERREMQSTLEAFARLSPEQRRVCVESFQKFARLTPAERALFLRNAARWERMTPEERATWKKLVTRLPPLPAEPAPMPPRPQVPMERSGSIASATNVP
jgi:hypothetical protein